MLSDGQGRGASVKTSLTCRQLCAQALMSGSSFKARGIAPEANPADAPSRGKRVVGKSLFEAVDDTAIEWACAELQKADSADRRRAARTAG